MGLENGWTATDNKSKKYDRQLRIWGAHGQALLEQSKICLLRCGPTGSETLKNLVLGGTGAFTVVDDAKVQASDLGNNFLLDASSLGQSRAQHVTSLLQELNESVAGSFVEESPEALLEANPDFFAGFALVIATQILEPAVLKLEANCLRLGVRLLVVRSYGLMGYLRASVQEQTVIESQPDNLVEDLRFHRPWRELEEFAMGIDLASADDIQHKHIPYAVLLIQAVRKWHEAHGPNLPATSKEKAAFRDILKSWQRAIEGVPLEEENFTEAIENSRKVFNPPSISSEISSILFGNKTAALEASSSDFWFMAAALRDFVEAEGGGNLPIQGTIPDMWATTELYLAVQRIYRERADKDAAAVAAHLQRRLAGAGRDPNAIPLKTLKHFVKHAQCLRWVRWRSIAEEVDPSRVDAPALRRALGAEDTGANACLYLLLRAVDRFHALHSRFPGCYQGEFEDDVPLLKNVAVGIMSELGVAHCGLVDDLVHEMVRCGGGELHAVAAVMAGMAAQEAIKLLTFQFVPMSGALIYNAMSATSSVFRF